MNENMKTAIDGLLTVTPEPEDYTGEDGLLYCGKCRTPKEAYFPEGKTLIPSHDRHPVLCACRKKEQEEQQTEQEERRHSQTVDRLKQQGFTDPAMREWTFANDNGRCQQMENAHFFVKQWELMQKENIGLLLWGDVGTGKSFMSSCIANAVIDLGFSAVQTDIGYIVSTMESSFEDRRRNLDRILGTDLLLIEDLGTQRCTEYMMEHVFTVVDGRYKNGKPMVITTNFTLNRISHAKSEDPWCRVFDRILERCFPIEFKGTNRRRENGLEMRKAMRKKLGIE